jgi:ABC-type transport system involved in cytochrome bd biosynthesis fused ATPase/permease subunit
MTALIGPVLALLGVLLGAYFTRNRENEKARRDRRSQVYTKYLDVISTASSPKMVVAHQKQMTGMELNSDDIAALDKNTVDFANAHSNIVVYGAPEVVTALSHFYDVASGAGGLTDPAVNTALIDLIKAMRRDSEAEDYPTFGTHVDNIIGAKAEQRKAAILGQRQVISN